MDSNSNKSNKKIIIFLITFIVSLIVINFIFANPKYEITTEIIVCLSLLVVLSLSEMFDNLSIPKVITLSKNVKEVKKENNDLKDTNIRLLEQINNIKNSNSQNIFLPNSFSTIGSSNINDLNKTDIIEETEELDDTDSLKTLRVAPKVQYNYMHYLEIFILRKALNIEDDTQNHDIQFEVKLVNNKLIDDNIMKNEARFDALESTDNENIFYEVKTSPNFIDFSYQLHYMLRTIEVYEDFSKTSCKLVLLLPKYEDKLRKLLPNGNVDIIFKAKERIINRFQPAIDNHLLEIREIDITKKELDDYIKEKEINNDYGE